MALERTYWYEKNLGRQGYKQTKPVPAPEMGANLVGSKMPMSGMETDYGMPQLHLPVIDIDIPCQLLSSSTAGHYHLYIDKPMSWWRYKRLLKSLVKAGIVEKGYYKASLKCGQTLVRKPGITKTPTPSAKPGHTIRLTEIKGAIDNLIEDMK